jgi:hypothetical protein
LAGIKNHRLATVATSLEVVLASSLNAKFSLPEQDAIPSYEMRATRQQILKQLPKAATP